MIELPEADVLAKQINQTLTDKRIKQIIAREAYLGGAIYFCEGCQKT